MLISSPLRPEPLLVLPHDRREVDPDAQEGPAAEMMDERDGLFTAISEPNRETALIGAIVLEDLDLLVDCATQRLIPRDPSGATYEIE